MLETIVEKVGSLNFFGVQLGFLWAWVPPETGESHGDDETSQKLVASKIIIVSYLILNLYTLGCPPSQ